MVRQYTCRQSCTSGTMLYYCMTRRAAIQWWHFFPGVDKTNVSAHVCIPIHKRKQHQHRVTGTQCLCSHKSGFEPRRPRVCKHRHHIHAIFWYFLRTSRHPIVIPQQKTQNRTNGQYKIISHTRSEGRYQSMPSASNNAASSTHRGNV